MQKLIEIVANPSGFDSFSNYIGETDFQDFECVLTQSRDSDTLSRSNFTSALAMLGGESENVRIDRFGHWACGWWEALSVKPNTPEYQIALDIEKSLADYPVVNEDHWSELEHDEAQKVWQSCYTDEGRLEYIREHRRDFEFHDFADLRACVKGEFFNGDYSEMAN